MPDDANPGQPDVDELGEWDEPRRPVESRRRLGSMISVRFTPAEVTELRDAAARLGQTVSEFVRGAALAAANDDGVAVEPFNRVTYGSPTGLGAASTVSTGLVVPDLRPLAS